MTVWISPNWLAACGRLPGWSSWPSHCLSHSHSLPQAGTSWRPRTLTQRRFKFPQALRLLVTWANCKSFGTWVKWGSHRNSGILSGKLAATKSHTRQQCPSLWPPRQHPCPYAGPCPCPAQPGFKRPWAQEPVNPDTGCAPRSPVPLCLCFSGSNHPTPNRAPAACCPANFSALFLQVHKTVLPADRLSKSLTQILARPVRPSPNPSRSPPTWPRPPRAKEPAGLPACRPGPPRSLPSGRALTDLRQAQLHEAQSPRCAPPKRVHGVGATGRASGVEPEGPGAGRGPRSTGQAGRPDLSEAGVRLAMRAPRKLGAVFIRGLREWPKREGAREDTPKRGGCD